MQRGEIRKVTHDHSPVGEREDAGELSEAEAMRHPRRNEVFRDVGSEAHAPDDADFIEVQRFAFEPDLAVVMCSDGLSDLVDSRQIRTVVERHAGDPDAAARGLIAAANQAGGKDNVTVVVVEGEEFHATQEASAASPGQAMRWLWVLLALVAGLGGGFFAGWKWAPKPAPVALPPRILVAGMGGQYGTITAAIADAHAGDTVELMPGEYREQVRLKSGVTLRGRVPLEAVLRSPVLNNGPAIIAENVEGARLSGVRIVGDPQIPLAEGILLVNSEVAVDDVNVSGAGVGMEIRGGKHPSVRASTIEDCLAQGLLVSGAAEPWISHDAFRRNKGGAVSAREGARPTLAENVFDKSDIEPAELMEVSKTRNLFLDGGAAHRPAARRKE
jgi:hypothetical protein